MTAAEDRERDEMSQVELHRDHRVEAVDASMRAGDFERAHQLAQGSPIEDEVERARGAGAGALLALALGVAALAMGLGLSC